MNLIKEMRLECENITSIDTGYHDQLIRVSLANIHSMFLSDITPREILEFHEVSDMLNEIGVDAVNEWLKEHKDDK